jgi:plastocyanin
LRPPASAQGEAGAAAANNVAIDNFVFTPAELTVKVGTTVTWTNDDDIPHVVLATDHRFRSGAGYRRRLFVHLAAPGRFGYFCALHPHMVGAIVLSFRERHASKAVQQGGGSCAVTTTGRASRRPSCPISPRRIGLARWLTGSATDAEDVVQDAALRPYRGIAASPAAMPAPGC